MLGLEGKVVWVTGGSRGIGAEIVALLEELGAKPAYCNRTLPGPKGFHVKADVTDAAAMDAAVARVEKELGPIYGVVANAGVTADSLFPKLTQESWRSVMATNLDGVYNTLRPVLPRLFERKAGSVVLISSIVGERGNVGQANYAASKAALLGLAKSLAREGARHGVRVNAVAPGFIATEMIKSIPDKVKERLLSDNPMGRFGEPREVAWAVAYLLSPAAASYVTGVTLRVNGGQHT